jgi:glutaredoxin
MRCAEHGLAVGPEGRCVLCERRKKPVSRRAARGLLVGAGLGLLGACAGIYWLRESRPLLRAEPPAMLTSRRVTLTPIAETAAIPAMKVPPPVDVAPPPSEPVAEAPEPTPSGLADHAAALPDSAPEPAPTPAARAPSSTEIRAAMTTTPIEMFSASWCPACRKARSFLQANGLNFVDHDVDTDANALAELKRRTGRTAIPVIDIDGTQLPAGFSPRDVTGAVVASVERRLGVTGIRIEPVAAQPRVTD